MKLILNEEAIKKLIRQEIGKNYAVAEGKDPKKDHSFDFKMDIIFLKEGYCELYAEVTM